MWPFGKFIYHGTAGNDSLISQYTTAVNEVFYGYAGDDYIDGRLGADRMYGGTGHDTYVVDNAGDQVIENANEGFDTVRVSFSYTIPVNVERLELTGTAAINATGSSADDRLYGNSSSNILWGLDGNDILNGNGGTDTAIGGTGNDTYYIDNGGDVVLEYANEGSDWVATSVSYTLAPNVESGNIVVAGDLNLTGNGLDNRLVGNGWANVLSGGLGNDTLEGENGNDVLVGGAGADTMEGGWAADTFRFLSVNDTGALGEDFITDFSQAQGDLVDLSAIDANTNVGGDQAFQFIGNNAAYTGTAGELRFNFGSLEGDVDGDAQTDFYMTVDTSGLGLNAGAFLL